MTPLHVKDDSEHKQSGPAGKMCRKSQQHSITNFPPIAESNRLTSPGAQRRGSHDERIRIRCEPPAYRPAAGAPSSRPRSNSDFSLGDVWSSGRRSICSSNGRSSMSFSSGDASTVASTEKLLRRKFSPRRVMISRPVTPFPGGEEASWRSRAGEAMQAPTPSPPQTKSTKTQQLAYQARRRKTAFSLAQQPIDEEQIAGKLTSIRTRRKAEDGLERKPQPPSQHKDSEATKTSERRRRKSLPDMVYQRQKGEARKTDTEGKKTEARVLTEIMDRVTRDRIMNWLTEVAHSKDDDHHNALQEALSAIDEE